MFLNSSQSLRTCLNRLTYLIQVWIYKLSHNNSHNSSHNSHLQILWIYMLLLLPSYILNSNMDNLHNYMLIPHSYILNRTIILILIIWIIRHLICNSSLLCNSSMVTAFNHSNNRWAKTKFKLIVLLSIYSNEVYKLNKTY